MDDFCREKTLIMAINPMVPSNQNLILIPNITNQPSTDEEEGLKSVFPNYLVIFIVILFF